MNFRRPSRGLKYLLAAVGALVVLGLIIVLVAVQVLQNDDYKNLAIRGVAHLTDCRMVVEGAFEVAWSRNLSFTATDIRFESLGDGDPPALSTIRRIHTQIALAPLLRGILLVKDLEIEGLQFAHVDGRPATDRDLTLGWPWSLFTPVVERVALDDLHFRFKNEKQDQANELLLQQLTLDDSGDKGPLLLQGNGTFDAADFQMAGRMGGTFDLFKGNSPFPIDLEFSIADLQATLTGAIDHPMEGRGFNLKIAVEEQELANLLQIFRQDVPPLGRFTLKTNIAGDIKALQIADLALEISNGSSIRIAAAGSVPDLATGRGTEIEINQDIENNNLLSWLFPDDWKVLQEFHLSAALGNIDGEYTIEKIDARIANDKGLVFKADGSLELGNPFRESPVTAADLNLHLISPDTAGIRPLLTDAIPEIGGIRASTRLVGPIDNLALEDLLIERGGSGPVQVTTRGRIGRIPLGDDEPLEDMDFTVNIQAENSKILREFYEIPLGELGGVDLSGRIVGSSRRFKLQEIELKTKTEEGLETHVTGGIDFARREDGRVVGDLGFKLQFESPTLGISEPLLGLQIMRSLGPINGVADVAGTTENLSFENILAAGGHPERLYAEWRGRIDSIPLQAESVSSGHETYGNVYAARSSDFAALFGITLPDIGPVRGSWRDTDHQGVLGMADIKVTIGDGKRFNLKANGKIDNLVDQKKYKSMEEEEIEYAGVDFQFDLKTADTHNIAKLIGIAMPDLGPVTGSWRLTGGERGLAIHDARLESASTTGLQIAVTGGVSHIDVRPEGGVPELDFQFKARAPRVEAIPGLDAYEFPALGTLQAAARLKYRDNALDLEAVQIRTGPEQEPTLVIEGLLRDVHDPQRVNLEARFETGTRPWLENALNRTITANPQMTGTLQLGRSGEDLRIDRFQVQANDMGGLVMEGVGTVALADEGPHVDLQIRSAMADPEAWGNLVEIPVPPMAATQITGWYRQTGNQHKFTGDVRLGESRFQTVFQGTTREGKPVIEATMAAQTLRLQDLGFYPESGIAAPSLDPAPRKEDLSPLFTDKPLPLTVLNDFDLSLKILADQIVARENVFKNVGLDVSIQDGRLQIGPTTVDYLQGTSTISAFIDTTGAIPVMSLNMVAEDADLQELLTSVDRPLVLGGQLTLYIDLHSAGRSAREIAANLQGETAFVVEKGQIQRKIELLSSDALDFLFTGPANQRYTDLDCTAFRMLFQDGTGTVQVFFVETPGMRAEAFGHVDLSDETIALIINSTAKRRFFRHSSPVRVSGPLQDPSFTKVPAAEAAILTGQILLPVVALPARALGYLWSVISRDDKVENCFIISEDEP